MIRLIIVKPDKQTITIDQSVPAELTVGRAADCNICLDFDNQASRRHAVFLVDPPKISIRDLQSTNGIVVNGDKHASASPNEPVEVELTDGDQVLIGQTKIKIVMPGRTERIRRPGTRRPLTTHGKDTRSRTSVTTRHVRTTPRTGSPESETSVDLPPVTPSIPGWVLTRHLAMGLTGGVYLGEEQSGAKRAALKIMGQGLSLPRSILETLRSEVDAARQERHASIATILGAGELNAPGGVYLAYEYIAASNLSVHQATLERKRFPLRQAYTIIRQVSEAVCFMHRRESVHLDLKPASILLQKQDGKYKARLTDHGFNEFLDSSGIVPRGRPGTNPAKLGFVAPEETHPENEISSAADVFSLAAIFYSMLAGKSPYRFAPGRDSLKVVQDAWMQPVEEAIPDLPIPVVVVLERGLAVDPYLRYGTACEFLEALEACF